MRLEYLEDRLSPATVNWVGNGDGLSWGDPQNWSGGALPAAADDVVINTAPPDVVVIHDSGTDTIHSLQSQNGVLLSGGSLTIAAGSAINNTLTLSGTLTANANLDLTNLMQTDGELNGSGTVTISGQWTFGGGLESGLGHTVLNGAATLSGGYFTTFTDRTVDNHGTATIPADDGITLSGAAVWNNLAGSNFFLQGSADVGNPFASGNVQFNNGGTLKQTGGTGASSIDVPLINTGTVEVPEGALTLAAGSQNNGIVKLAAGTTLSLSQWTGTGMFNLAAGSRLNISDVSTLQAGGTINLAADSLVMVGDSFTVASGATITGAAGDLRVSTFGNLTVAGSVTARNLTVAGGTVTVTGAVTVQNLTQNGTVTGTGNVTINGQWTWTRGEMSGTGHTILHGTATLRGGFYSTLIDRTVDSTAAVTVPAGEGITWSGDAVWNNQAGASFVLQDNARVDNFLATTNAAFNNAGVLEKVGSGTATIAIKVVNSGEVKLTNRATGALRIDADCTQTTAGRLTFVVGGPNPGHDFARLQITGVATLAGTLNVSFINGEPPGGHRILTYGSQNGRFDTSTFPETYDATGVLV
jgi:filamentous hemagglutinin